MVPSFTILGVAISGMTCESSKTKLFSLFLTTWWIWMGNSCTLENVKKVNWWKVEEKDRPTSGYGHRRKEIASMKWIATWKLVLTYPWNTSWLTKLAKPKVFYDWATNSTCCCYSFLPGKRRGRVGMTGTRSTGQDQCTMTGGGGTAVVKLGWGKRKRRSESRGKGMPRMVPFIGNKRK